MMTFMKSRRFWPRVPIVSASPFGDNPAVTGNPPESTHVSRSLQHVISVSTHPTFRYRDRRILYLDQLGMTTSVGLLEPDRRSVVRLPIDTELAKSGVMDVADVVPCPYHDQRIAVHHTGPSWSIVECWHVDESAGRVENAYPAGWESSRLSAPLAWLSGSYPGFDSIAGLYDDTSEPVVFITQYSKVMNDDHGPVPISKGFGGKHRLSIEGSHAGHTFYLDGRLLSFAAPGCRFHSATWSPDNRWLLITIILPGRSENQQWWLVDVTGTEAPREFKPSPACLPIVRLEFMTNSSFAAEGIDDSTSSILLYEIALDGRALRQLTFP